MNRKQKITLILVCFLFLTSGTLIGYGFDNVSLQGTAVDTNDPEKALLYLMDNQQRVDEMLGQGRGQMNEKAQELINSSREEREKRQAEMNKLLDDMQNAANDIREEAYRKLVSGEVAGAEQIALGMTETTQNINSESVFLGAKSREEIAQRLKAIQQKQDETSLDIEELLITSERAEIFRENLEEHSKFLSEINQDVEEMLRSIQEQNVSTNRGIAGDI